MIYFPLSCHDVKVEKVEKKGGVAGKWGGPIDDIGKVIIY